jgi:hypothetical protein
MRPLVVALILLSACPLLAAPQLVAPAPVLIGPSVDDDGAPVSLSNGTNTLLAWNLEYSHRPAGIMVRILEDSAPALRLSGWSPKLATNGREYLVLTHVAYGRYIHPIDNVTIQIVSADGSLGARRVLNTSLSATAGGVVWNGQHWVVGYSTEGDARVVLLDAGLERVATVGVGAGQATRVMTIQGRVWAFVSRPDEIEALEILPNGTTGARHVFASSAAEVVATAEGALLFNPESSGVTVAAFDSSAGFSAARTIVTGRVLWHAVPWDDGAAVLLTDAARSRSELLLVDATGATRSTHPLNASLVADIEIRLGHSRDGLLYFESRQNPDAQYLRHDAFAYRLRNFELEEPPELISIENLGRQFSPVIASNGTNAVAFWAETNADLTVSTRTRSIDANGLPYGPIHILQKVPFISDLSFDGEQFLAVFVMWGAARQNVYAVTITRDGAVAGEPMLIGEGGAPAIASRNDATFVLWSDPFGTLRGTNLREDASAVVPGGAPILPAFAEAPAAEITASAEGFLVGWATGSNLRTVGLSPGGTVIRGWEFPTESRSWLRGLASHGNSALGMVTTMEGTSYLYALGGNGVPFELFDPHWGRWTPHSVQAIADGRFLVVIVREGSLFTSEISMTGAFIVGITPLRLLGRDSSVTTVDGTPLGLYVDGGVYVVTGNESTRPRAVRAR